jgi:predicted  nucleic acid-binding Zn-ribbon protein
VVDPVFWLGVSILFVAVSIAAVLVAAMPAFRELARAARSAEKLFDTLNRELPPTLQSIRDTSSEIVGLTDDMSEGVQGVGRVVQQVDQSISGVQQKTQVTTRSVVSGVKAAWKAFRSPDLSSSKNISPEDSSTKDIGNDSLRLPASTRPTVKIEKKDEFEKPVDASVEAEIALSHYSDSVSKLSEDLENIRDRLTQEKSGDVIKK